MCIAAPNRRPYSTASLLGVATVARQSLQVPQKLAVAPSPCDTADTSQLQHCVKAVPKIDLAELQRSLAASTGTAAISTETATDFAAPRCKDPRRRRRAPQRPGKTATNKQRLFVKHNYHDLANEPDDLSHSPDPKKNGTPPLHFDAFPMKLHRVLDEVESEGLSDIISWQPHGRAFVIRDPPGFIRAVMPRYFPTVKKLTSLQRQLNLYGFERLTKDGPDEGSYYHECFLRGRPGLTAHRMARKRVKGTGYKAASNPAGEPEFYTMPFVGELKIAHAPPQVQQQTIFKHISASPIGSISVADSTNVVNYKPIPCQAFNTNDYTGVVSDTTVDLSNSWDSPRCQRQGSPSSGSLSSGDYSLPQQVSQWQVPSHQFDLSSIHLDTSGGTQIPKTPPMGPTAIQSAATNNCAYPNNGNAEPISTASRASFLPPDRLHPCPTYFNNTNRSPNTNHAASEDQSILMDFVNLWENPETTVAGVQGNYPDIPQSTSHPFTLHQEQPQKFLALGNNYGYAPRMFPNA